MFLIQHTLNHFTGSDIFQSEVLLSYKIANSSGPARLKLKPDIKLPGVQKLLGWSIG